MIEQWYYLLSQCYYYMWPILNPMLVYGVTEFCTFRWLKCSAPVVTLGIKHLFFFSSLLQTTWLEGVIIIHIVVEKFTL